MPLIPTHLEKMLQYFWPWLVFRSLHILSLGSFSATDPKTQNYFSFLCTSGIMTGNEFIRFVFLWRGRRTNRKFFSPFTANLKIPDKLGSVIGTLFTLVIYTFLLIIIPSHIPSSFYYLTYSRWILWIHFWRGESVKDPLYILFTPPGAYKTTPYPYIAYPLYIPYLPLFT